MRPSPRTHAARRALGPAGAWLYLLLGAGPVVGAPPPTAFDALLATPNLWTLRPDEFQVAAAALPFSWTSSSRDSARAAQPGMTLYGLPVVEVIARFEKGRLGAITANVYARGDAGDLARGDFETLVKASSTAVSKVTQMAFTVRGKDPNNAVQAEGLLWRTPGALYTLEYSSTKEVKSRDIPFRAEFVRLHVTPPPKGASALVSSTGASRPLFNPALHLQRDVVTNDYWLKDVPMVDQGQKGYCVVAATERVMRYYGSAVDANELAQIANADSGEGTNYAAMIGALKKVATRLKVRVREIEKLDVKDLLTLIKDYNRTAKKAGAAEVRDPGYHLDLGAIFGAMKGELLRETRTRNKTDLARFQAQVREHIDKGVPLLWTVHLGLFPEPGVPQTGGGHMRLIIGYNPKTNDVLFSDSWGPGHELKRMTLENAWTITTGLATVEPM